MTAARTALIIGSSGLVAPVLAAHLQRRGWRILQTSRKASAATMFDLSAPDVAALPDADAVFLVAAETSLSRCERKPALARQVNVVAPARIAQRYAAAGAAIIGLSTNLVFDGATSFTKPHAARRPQCVYGLTKMALENSLLGISETAVLRITKIAQTSGPLIGSWPHNLQQGQTVTPFSDDVCAPVR
jgi:dTDP-4-dehydrorhamnose reductase